MKAHQLKEIRESLQFGDITTIAREVGVSTTTVQTALRGESSTDTNQLIILHAQTIIKQRTDRKEQLRRIILKQREARLSSGHQ